MPSNTRLLQGLDMLEINAERLQNNIEQMAQIGADSSGGISRLALTDEDKAGRDLLKTWFEEQGCTVHIDPIGNMFATFSGLDQTLAPVLTGSHNDTQPNGGKFDGTLGVLAGLEIITTLRENGKTLNRDLIVVNWTNEEGSRFSPGCTGSGVWSGKLDCDTMYALTDKTGKTIQEELERIGYLGKEPFPSSDFHAAFELHIEQGPVLDHEKITIGIPEGIVSPHWYRISVTGEANHAGSTPMKGRRDAMYAFSLMCAQIIQTTREFETVVATVGHVEVHPNSLNVIPGQVDYTLDIRGWDQHNTDTVCSRIEKEIEQLAKENDCTVNIDRFWEEERVQFAPHLMDIIEASCKENGISCKRMYSGANHDMIYMNTAAPGAMIFVPSVGGKSHSPLETTSYRDCAAGVNMLLQSILKASK